MAKWAGKIGFTKTVDKGNGIYEEQISERTYVGDLLINRWKRQITDKVNDDITVSNQISIVSDNYAFENFSFIAYVEFAGTKWKVSDIEVQYPRLILNLGGMYHE